MISDLKNQLPELHKIHYFSDGCGGQYKNCKNFTKLCLHKKDYNISAVWNFFATSHGKSSCDGLGGTLKWLVARTSLLAPVDGQITTADLMFKWCTDHVSGVKFQFLSEEDIKYNEKSYDLELESRFSGVSMAPGLIKCCFIPHGEHCLKMKVYLLTVYSPW